MGNIIRTPLLHSDDLARYTALTVEKRMLLNQITHGDLERTVIDLIRLFADRFRGSLTTEEYDVLLAIDDQKVKGSTRLFHERDKNMILLRAFLMDEWAEPSWFSVRFWFPLKAKLGWNAWMNPTNPLKTIIRTDDLLCFLEEYDAWVMGGEPLAQFLFGFLDKVKLQPIKSLDKSKLRVNCFGDDMLGYLIAAAAAKIIQDVLLPEEKRQLLVQEMRKYIERKLEVYDLTIHDVVVVKRRWEGLTEEEFDIDLDAVLRKPEVAYYFSALQKPEEVQVSPLAVHSALANHVPIRFGGAGFTSASYHIMSRTSILARIKDEPFLLFLASIIGAESCRVANNFRTEQERQYPERFSRINPLGLFLLECRVESLRGKEQRRRGHQKV